MAEYVQISGIFVKAEDVQISGIFVVCKWYPVHLLYTQCLIAGEIKTIGGGIRVPWTLFLVGHVMHWLTDGPRRNKTCLRGFRQREHKPSLLSSRD